MSYYFDGTAELLNDIFGDPVEVTRVSGRQYTIQAVFRREPVEVMGSDGFPVLIMNPTLKLPDNIRLSRGDIIVPSIASGQRYIVQSNEISPSPDEGRFILYELELDQ